jgi:hypothetical protein
MQFPMPSLTLFLKGGVLENLWSADSAHVGPAALGGFLDLRRDRRSRRTALTDMGSHQLRAGACG